MAVRYRIVKRQGLWRLDHFAPNGHAHTWVKTEWFPAWNEAVWRVQNLMR